MQINDQNMLVNDQVAVVFKDASEYELQVRRRGAFNGLTCIPYAIVCSKEYGEIVLPNAAPSEVAKAILAKLPDACSTWMRVGHEWLPVCEDEGSNGAMYDQVFDSVLLDRVDSLVLIFQALGIRKISISVSESTSHGDMSQNQYAGGIHANAGVFQGEVSGSYSRSEKTAFARTLEKHVTKEFPKHDNCDMRRVTELMNKYGFSGDKQLIALRDERVMGRSPSKLTHYTFSGSFVGEVESKIEGAMKIAASVKPLKKKFGGGIQGSLSRQSQEKKEFMQTVTIALEN